MPSLEPGDGTSPSLELTVERDGQVCIAARHLHELELVHLVSGLDEPTAAELAGSDCSTTRSGYTEWVGAAAPVTIGWDWQLEPASQTLSRCGLPSSNIILKDEQASRISERNTRLLLARFIDDTDWQEVTFRRIFERYR